VDERLRNWHPTDEEIEAILDEMRPIIREFALRDAPQAAPIAF
jgi:hypothetical protein